MIIFIHDGSFEAFLSAIFYSYHMKVVPDKIVHEKYFQGDAFASTHHIITDLSHAKRVWQGICKKSTPACIKKIYRTYLSEYPAIDNLLFKYVCLILNSNDKVELDCSNQVVTEFNSVYSRILKEVHRISMFTRFQHTADGLYFSGFAPEYNIMPMVTAHFKDRFADQRWVIYDIKRDYGFYYNFDKVIEIRMAHSNINPTNGKLPSKILCKDELFIQNMWGNYYKEATIKERNNRRLHVQLLPKKYWKFLPEKDFLK